MEKKRMHTEPFFPNTEKSRDDTGIKQASLSFFCRKNEDKSGSHHFIRSDGEEADYTVIHHGADPCRLTPADAAEIVRLLAPILSGKQRETKI